jgi:hypothetical protein
MGVMLDAGCWLLDTGCSIWMLVETIAFGCDTRFWILDSGFWLLVTDAGYWMQARRSLLGVILDFGCSMLDAGGDDHCWE